MVSRGADEQIKGGSSLKVHAQFSSARAWQETNVTSTRWPLKLIEHVTKTSAGLHSQTTPTSPEACCSESDGIAALIARCILLLSFSVSLEIAPVPHHPYTALGDLLSALSQTSAPAKHQIDRRPRGFASQQASLLLASPPTTVSPPPTQAATPLPHTVKHTRKHGCVRRRPARSGQQAAGLGLQHHRQ